MKRAHIGSLFVVIGLLSFIVVASIQPVKAEYAVSSYAWFTADNYVGMDNGVHPTGSGTSAASLTFQSGMTGYLTRINLALARGVGTDARIKVRIEGTGNSKTASPNGTVLATSTNSISSTDLSACVSGAAASHIFEFTFDATYQLSSGQWYAMVIYISEVTFIGGSNDTGPYWDTAGSTFNGEYNIYNTGAWGAGATTAAFPHEIVVSSTLGGDGTVPLPTGGLDVDTSDVDAVMDALIGYGVPVVVMLLPTIFIWLIGGRGKWPMLIGIAIGTGIGYVFGLVPPWLVFLVSIGEVGMAYQSVRSGN